MEPLPALSEWGLREYQSQIRRLAAALLRHPSDADDLAQDAWVALMQNGPRKEAAVGAWLRTVMPRLAAKRFRKKERDGRREERVAHSGEVESTAQAVERLETHRRVVEATLELPEPFLGTVVMRFFHDLSVAEIAERLDVPEATVRSRLRRGLLRLRHALGVDDHDEASTHSLLALAMSTSTKLAWTGCAAVAAVLAFVALDPAGDRPATGRGPDPDAAAIADLSASTESTAPADGVSGPDDGYARVATGSGEGDAAETTTPDVLTRVLLRAVDADGFPLAGATLGYPAETPPPGSEPSASDGRIVLVVPSEMLWKSEGRQLPRAFLLQAPGRVATRLNVTAYEGEDTDVGDVTLERAGGFRGKVVNRAGDPIENARIVATDVEVQGTAESARLKGPSVYREFLEARTEADGTYEIDGLPLAPGRLWAHAPGFGWAVTDPVAPEPDSLTMLPWIELSELRDKERIEGVVVDADGQPIAGAAIQSMSVLSSWNVKRATSAEDGTFRLALEDVASHHLYVTAGESYRTVYLEGIEPGTLDLVVTLEEGRWVTVEARGKDGAILDSAWVQVLDDDGELRTMNLQLVTEEDEAGRVQLLEPGAPYQLQVTASGYDSNTTQTFEPGAAPEVIVVELERRPAIRGRVLAAGRPVAGAWVKASAILDGEFRIRVEGFRMRLFQDFGGGVTTNEDGRFEIPLSQDWAKNFAILAGAEGFAVAESAPLAVENEDGLDGVELHLLAGGSLEGRVLVPLGEEALGRPVVASRGDGVLRKTRTDEEGLYRFEHMTAGGWQVESPETEAQLTMSVDDDRSELEWDCFVSEGATTYFDVDLTRSGDPVLTGRLTIDGEPAAGWTASIRPVAFGGSDEGLRPVLLDARGAFEILAKQEPCELRLQSPLVGGVRLDFRERIDFTTGSVEWEEDLLTTAVSGASSAGSATIEFVLRDRTGRTIRAAVAPADNGAFRHPNVPRGELEVRRANPSGGWTWIQLPPLVVGSDEIHSLSLD